MPLEKTRIHLEHWSRFGGIYVKIQEKKLPLSAYFWNKRHKTFESLPNGCGSRPYSSPRNVPWEKDGVAFGEELNSLLMPLGQRLQYML